MNNFDDLKNEKRYDGKRTNRALSSNWIGEEGNAWKDEQTGKEGFSKVVDTENLAHFAILGQVDGDTDINVWISQNGINFYFSQELTDEITMQDIPDAPEWEDDTNYKVGDLVEHEVEGTKNIYSAIRSHKSSNDNQPPDENTWELVFEDIEGDYPEVWHIQSTLAARYIQLQSTNNVTATATIVAKP